MRRLNEDREVYFEKLAELLNGFVADRFHEYQELLQEEVQKELKRLQEVTKKHMTVYRNAGNWKRNCCLMDWKHS